MTNLGHVQLFSLLALVFAVHTQNGYPRFEFKDETLGNNSFVFLEDIGEGNNSLRCVTNYSVCCGGNRVRGNWYNERGIKVQGPHGNRSLYVTRSNNGVVNLNRRRGGQSGLWRCNIPGSFGGFESIYIYIGTSETGTNHVCLVRMCKLLHVA